ncbi:AI-2E family transporter, partial [Planomicrobium okeanokoites]|uniref:AI-2E family transporter n=1 Tax=Planomicrobium okeanokoites TaxID=244 RepID=UPI003561DA6A
MEPEDKPSFFRTNYIQFLGGRNTLFTLIALILIGLIIFIFREVSFIFNPLSVFMQTVVLPVTLAMILYYLLRPVLRLLERFRIKRIWGILIIFMGVVGLLTLVTFLILPFLREQLQMLIEEFPQYFMQLLTDIDAFLRTSFVGDYYTGSNFDIDQLMETLPDNLAGILQDVVASIITGITGFLSTITSFVLSIVIVPFILFYLLKDGEKLPEYILKLLSPRLRDDTREVFGEADKQLSAYI